MNRKASIVKKIVYALLALAIVALVVIRLKTNKEISQQSVYQYDPEQPLHVAVDTLQQEAVKAEERYSGTFEPKRETKVSAEIQGKIVKVAVDVGSLVKKGQPVLQLDNTLLKLQLEAVEVQIEGLEADVRRYTALVQADAIQGVQLEKAELGLKAALVQKATLEEQVRKTAIRAPFAGIVTAKLTEEGAFAMPGAPLLQITDIAQLRFTIHVPERDLLQFRLHQACPVTVDAYPEMAFAGTVTLKGSKANVGNHFPVEFSVRNTPDFSIKSGMFGKVVLKKDTLEKGILIPSSAIVGTPDQPQVYMVRDGKAILRDITVSGHVQNRSIVVSGVAEGDVLVTQGFVNLFNGARVTVH